jgi:hypothetical protein
LLDSKNEIAFLNQGKNNGSNIVRVSRLCMRSSPGFPQSVLSATTRLTSSWTRRLAQEWPRSRVPQPEGIDAYIDGLVAQVQTERDGYQQQIDLAQDVSRRESEATDIGMN